MKKIIYVFLICFLLGAFFLAPATAYAVQLATAVPTNTFIPPSPTATAILSSCPVGTPAGWGTYTPSPLWDLTCGSCSVIVTPTSTVTPSPVATWSGTGTPVATSTITATPEITVTPVISPYVSLTCGSPQYLDITCTQVDDHTLSFGGVGGNVAPYLSGARFYYAAGSADANEFFIRFDVLGVNDVKYRHYPNTGANSFGLIYYNQYTSAFIGDFSTIHSIDPGSVGVESVPIGQYDFSFINSQTAGEVRFYTNDSANIIKQQFWNASIVGGGAGSTMLLSSSPDFGEVVATPSPTPYVDLGYCSSVAPTLPDFGYDLFVLDGEANCDLGWDVIMKDEEVLMPAVQICFQPSQFGVVRMFGNSYEIGVYALAAAAAFLWRFVRTV